MENQPDLGDYEDLLPPEDDFNDKDAGAAGDANAAKK
jgi:hypothetical protein